MRRGFVTLGDGGRQVHYRRSGSGRPVVVLPAAPDSSLAVEPFSIGVAAGGDFASLPAAGGFAVVSAGAAGAAGVGGAVVSDCCASAGAAANSISAMIAIRAMRNNDKTGVIVARQHSSARQPREARHTVMAGLDGRSSLPGLTSPGLTRGPIHPLRKEFLRRRWTRGSSPRVTGRGLRPILLCHCRA